MLLFYFANISAIDFEAWLGQLFNVAVSIGSSFPETFLLQRHKQQGH
jgi:hypothetical protein